MPNFDQELHRKMNFFFSYYNLEFTIISENVLHTCIK